MNKFKEYLDKRQESRTYFALRSKISIHTVLKLYRGERVRKDIARKVVRATKKEITLEDLGYGENSVMCG